MAKKTLLGFAMGLLLLSTAGVSEASVIDNFNDGTTNGWTTRAGFLNESGGFMSGSNISLGTINGYSGNSLGVDALLGGNSGYVALVLNYNSLSDNLFVKIQDNNGNGLFDTVFFYHGNNGNSAVSDGYIVKLANETRSSYFEVTDNGNGTVTAFAGATNESFTRTLTHIYTGAGLGIGFWENGLADNLYAPSSVPVPGAFWLLGSSLAGLAGLRRRGKSHS